MRERARVVKRRKPDKNAPLNTIASTARWRTAGRTCAEFRARVSVCVCVSVHAAAAMSMMTTTQPGRPAGPMTIGRRSALRACVKRKNVFNNILMDCITRSVHARTRTRTVHDIYRCVCLREFGPARPNGLGSDGAHVWNNKSTAPRERELCDS